MATNNDNGSKQVLTGERPMPRFFDWKQIDKVPELFDKDSSSQDKDSEHFVPAIQELINFTGPVGAGLSMEERERECYRIHNRLYDLFQTSYEENEMLAIFFHNSPNAVRLEFLKEKYDNAQATIDGLIEKEDIPTLISYLQGQEDRGQYFSKAITKGREERKNTTPEPEYSAEDYSSDETKTETYL